MTNESLGESPHRFDAHVTAESHFSWIRTRLAVERTMMAYLRTSVSLIGFGFAIVQFLGNFQEVPGVAPPRFPDAPMYLGLALIFCGILAAVIAVFEYRWTVRYLWSGGFAAIAGMSEDGRKTPLYAVAFILILIGLFAFFSVLLRVF
jgi:putative membrane protein